MRVVYSAQESKDRWVITGCTLAEPLNEEELRALIVPQGRSL